MRFSGTAFRGSATRRCRWGVGPPTDGSVTGVSGGQAEEDLAEKAKIERVLTPGEVTGVPTLLQ